jgi:hypothetical protein
VAKALNQSVDSLAETVDSNDKRPSTLEAQGLLSVRYQDEVIDLLRQEYGPKSMFPLNFSFWDPDNEMENGDSTVKLRKQRRPNAIERTLQPKLRLLSAIRYR